MVRTKAQLKTFFETGDYPTEEQFADLIDSFAHVNDLPTGPVPDDLKLVVGSDVSDGITELELPILLSRRYRIFRNNTKLLLWQYKTDASGTRTGFELTVGEEPFQNDEVITIEFY